MQYKQGFLTILLAMMLGFSSCGNNDEPEIDLDLGADIRLPDNETVILDAGNEGASYKWSTGASTRHIEVDTSGTYWVEVSAHGQTKTDTVQVELLWRTVKLESTMGTMQLWLYRETPLHKEGFLKLVNEGYFSSHNFNRVINQFVIQGGCPDLPDGFTDTSLFVAPEFHKHLTHKYGALGGGRDDNPGKKTNICQFYIVDKQNGPYDIKNLDANYTIFGKVIQGLDVVQDISKVDTDEDDAPVENVGFSLTMELYSAEELREQFDFEVL